jgi:Immunity protein Imm5
MTLQEIINKGVSFVQEEPQHDLILGFRCLLLSAFDEIGGSESSRAGHRMRVKLATLAVERVLPLWESLFPVDQTPRQALVFAEKLVAGAASSPVAVKEIGRLWTHCDDLMWKHEDRQNVIMVGYGAIQVVREAFLETHFGCEQANDRSTDLDVEPYDHDSSFFAASAYSGGAPWEKSSDPQKRLEFWTWWLTSAVGMAMNVGEADGV